jgi:hypothetical protein
MVCKLLVRVKTRPRSLVDGCVGYRCAIQPSPRGREKAAMTSPVVSLPGRLPMKDAESW